MIKRLLPALISAASLTLMGCDKETSSTEPPANDAPEKEQAPDNKEAQDELADPSDVDEALRPLNLSKKQNAKIKAWMDKQGEAVDPADMAGFLRSIINDDQLEAFNALTQSQEDPDSGAEGDAVE